MDALDMKFEKFKESALRVCALPYYGCDEEKQVENFINGLPIPEDANIDWRNYVKRVSSEGKKIIRIIVVENPVNDYDKWILRISELNELAGEEILFISKDKYLKILGKRDSHDYWIFDRKEVAVMYYDCNNDYTHFETSHDVDYYLNLFNELYKEGIPLKDIFKKVRGNTMNIEL